MGKICPVCGAENKEDAKFCFKCGYQFNYSGRKIDVNDRKAILKLKNGFILMSIGSFIFSIFSTLEIYEIFQGSFNYKVIYSLLSIFMIAFSFLILLVSAYFIYSGYNDLKNINKEFSFSFKAIRFLCAGTIIASIGYIGSFYLNSLIYLFIIGVGMAYFGVIFGIILGSTRFKKRYGNDLFETGGITIAFGILIPVLQFIGYFLLYLATRNTLKYNFNEKFIM